MKNLLSILFLVSIVITYAYAEEGHNHGSESEHKEHNHKDGHDHVKHDSLEGKGHSTDDGHAHKKHKKNDGHDHGSDSSHDDHKEHGDHEGHEGHGGGKAIGKGKAIEEVDEKKGFRLSKEAIKTLKLKLNTVNGSAFKINKKTLVASKNVKGVYRFRAGFFKLLPAKITKELSDGYMVEVMGVDFGDQIVVNGVGLLRVTDVYSTDKSEYGHSH